MIHRIWRLSETSDHNNLGLACTDQGLLLGRTLLIERRDGRFVVRERDEIERLLSHAYRTGYSAGRIMPGLATVAAALNAGDQGLARIAAVHLRLPDLPDRVARDGMEAMDVLLKYARDESGGDAWNPALHPRAGTPPNPGWFAPTDGGGSSSTRTAQNDDPTHRSDAGGKRGPGLGPTATRTKTHRRACGLRRVVRQRHDCRMRTQSVRKSKDITRMSAGMRRLTISTPN